jgi:hypothetical protein
MRNFVIPDIKKVSAVFSALQMLILSAAELQIRQDEACAGQGRGGVSQAVACGGRGG